MKSVTVGERWSTRFVLSKLNELLRDHGVLLVAESSSEIQLTAPSYNVSVMKCQPPKQPEPSPEAAKVQRSEAKQYSVDSAATTNDVILAITELFAHVGFKFRTSPSADASKVFRFTVEPIVMSTTDDEPQPPPTKAKPPVHRKLVVAGDKAFIAESPEYSPLWMRQEGVICLDIPRDVTLKPLA